MSDTVDVTHPFRVDDKVILSRHGKTQQGKVAEVYSHNGEPRILFCRDADLYMIPCLPAEISPTG